MLQIGFTNVYFTLWSTSTETQYTHGGASYDTHRFTYIQNLSMDKDEAIKKAKLMGVEVLEVNEDLRGQSKSFEKQTKPTYEDFQFPFGKYENKDIRECNDDSYLEWFFGETSNVFAKDRILEITDLIFEDGEFYDGDEYKRMTDRKNAQQRLLDVCGTDDTIEVTFISNINAFQPTIRTEEHGEMEINIPTVRRSYNGHPYDLPEVNGKGKRIKNKTFKVNIIESQQFDNSFVITKIHF